MKASRAKSKRLRKQHKFLKRKEQKLFDKGLPDVEDLEWLESLERLNQEVGATNPEAPALAHAVDWSLFFEPTIDVSGSVVSVDTALVAGGSL
jgi:hypothetical protein